jgi:hypothetical protein
LLGVAILVGASLLLERPAQASPRCAQGEEDGYPYRMLNGLDTQRVDAEHLVVYPGSAVDNTGCALLNVYRSLTVNISAKGLGGRDDVLTPRDMEATKANTPRSAANPKQTGATYYDGAFVGKPLAGWYYVVLAREENPSAPVSAILTRQQSSQRTDQAGSAGVPQGFIYRRHLPIAYYFDPATGFRPMNCYGWPKPFCEWTRVLPRENYLIAKGVSSTTPQTIDASDWVPGYGRMLRMEIVLRANGQGGGAYISTLGRSDGEFLAGYVNHHGDRSVMQVEIAATSRETFSIRTDPGVTADIYAIGFSIAQPS